MLVIDSPKIWSLIRQKFGRWFAKKLVIDVTKMLVIDVTKMLVMNKE